MHAFFVGSRMPDLSLLILLIQLITSTTLALTCLSQTQLIGDDSACLVGLKASVQQLDVVTNSLGSSADLSTWSSEALSSPCSASASAETTSTTYSSSAPSNVMDGVACNNNRVYAITLNASNLAGTIPPAIANCTYLQILDLSSNGLAGAIPTSIGKLSYLTSLNLSNNQLDGPIPVGLSACEYLNDLDLHHNKLSGNIPGQIGLLQRLKVLDVSDNDLWGAIPTTLSNSSSTGLPRFNASSFQGNDGLYGFPLPPSAFRGLSVMAIVGIGLASGLVSLIVSFSAVCIWLRVTEQGYAAEEGKISQLVSET